MLLEEQYVKFIIEHDLTQGQFLLLYLIHKKRTDLIRAYKEKFPSEDGSMLGNYQTKDLIRKNFLVEDAKGKITLGRKFLDIFINKHTATDEIYSVYPTYYMKDGIPMSLSAMDRNVFANLYDNAIMSSVEEHLEVIKDIDYGIEHKLLNMGIEKFVKSKAWLGIRIRRKGQADDEAVDRIMDNEFD